MYHSQYGPAQLGLTCRAEIDRAVHRIRANDIRSAIRPLTVGLHLEHGVSSVPQEIEFRLSAPFRILT
jgi:hypothetical protein